MVFWVVGTARRFSGSLDVRPDLVAVSTADHVWLICVIATLVHFQVVRAFTTLLCPALQRFNTMYHFTRNFT